MPLFNRKRNLALEECRAKYLIRRDLLLADRLHEDQVKLAARRLEDWELNQKFEAECDQIRNREND